MNELVCVFVCVIDNQKNGIERDQGSPFFSSVFKRKATTAPPADHFGNNYDAGVKRGFI